MIARAIGRWRSRLDWKSTKSAVAPPTRAVAPGGGGSARIASTVPWLAPETKGRPLEAIRGYWENGGRWPEGDGVSVGARDARFTRDDAAAPADGSRTRTRAG